jgi:radical SAM protein with 4Fe4S-binding SPASM domain
MPSKIQYYKQLLSIYRNYRQRKVKVSTMPVRMWVELDARCNLQCIMCPNKELGKNQKGIMEWDTFEKVIEESSRFIHEMALHHRGESLLHPQAVKFITHAARHIPVTKLHTNGTILSDEMIDGLLASGLNRISFSFDGFEKESYEKIRIGANFDKVVNNIKNLLKKRSHRQQKEPVVAIEVIQLDKSQLQGVNKKTFIREFRRLGLDELIIKKPHNWAGHLPGKPSKKKYAPCTFLWNALLVLWNGDVVPCAQDFFALNVVGNVNHKTLREIWNDEPMQKLRAALAARKPGEYPACRDCDRLWRSTFMGIPSEYLKKFLLKKMP